MAMSIGPSTVRLLAPSQGSLPLTFTFRRFHVADAVIQCTTNTLLIRETFNLRSVRVAASPCLTTLRLLQTFSNHWTSVVSSFVYFRHDVICLMARRTALPEPVDSPMSQQRAHRSQAPVDSARGRDQRGAHHNEEAVSLLCRSTQIQLSNMKYHQISDIKYQI